MLSVPVREARCLRPSCQQGWSSQRLWGRIGSLRPAGLASAAPHPLPASLRSWPVVVHLSSHPKICFITLLIMGTLKMGDIKVKGTYFAGRICLLYYIHK